ncbi:MAG: MoxR family ATPase [Myxococcales bacterium]|nr:MoxR family ATPase [Myxococcales bacterium]
MVRPVATEALDRDLLGHAQATAAALLAEVGRAYIGAPDAAELMLTALLARGHVLLEGVPGVAKTTLCKAFAQALGISFRRIQFTPDLLPSDITGTYVLDMRTNTFALRAGPIFAHVVLGDEINRAPAKTQSALLEAMQERQVTIEGETRPLPAPFLVLATQNPVEQEGTYPLPEAQIDRFLVKLAMGYPSAADEKRMLATYGRGPVEVRAVTSPEELLRLQELCDRVHVESELLDYVVALAHHTRRHRRVWLGASPRAALALVQASKARALLRGRDFVLPDDVKALAPAVLSHRVQLAPDAELEGEKSSGVIAEALTEVEFRRAR